MSRARQPLSPERKIGPVLDALQARYGPRERAGTRDSLEVLVHGVLSQNTSDVNSERAYRALIERFGDWQGVARATVRQIAAAVRTGGLAEQKAETILRIMRWLEGEGGFSLDGLRGLDDAEAERRLTALKGVGIKTARLVLLFAFERPVFVVDTHVHRVAGRLGLIPARTGRERAHELLDLIVPDERKYSGHMLMIEHGRRTCRAQRPLCEGCPVRRWCAYVHEAVAGTGDAEPASRS